MGWEGSLPSGQGRVATGIGKPDSIPGGPDKQQSMLTHKLAQQQSRATMRDAVGVQSPPSRNARPTTKAHAPPPTAMKKTCMAHKTQLRTKEPESEYSKSTNDQATATNTNPGPM